MDVGATSLGRGTNKSANYPATRSSAANDISAHIANTLQESATSRLNSLLSTLVAEPLAAAPRMPQQNTLKNANVGEKASLPQPVTTPSFRIPPHIMGRNISNPTEDPVSHTRRIQKPRLGVRVPYRNLTSQIVTQDELAKELLERSLKNHPVHDIPEGGDLFFAIKLTQRLASKLSPSNSQTSSGVSQTDQSPSKSSQLQQRVDGKSVLSKDTPIIPETRELLAILEGDGDEDWIPSRAPTSHTVASPAKIPATPPQPPPMQINTKLDPALEKELALKQLMEFQNNSRRRKSDKARTPSEKPPRQKSRSKKTPVNKENGEKGNHNKNVSPSKLSVNSSASKIKTVKGSRKRKLDDNSSGEITKKPRVSVKRNVNQLKIELKGDASDKTDKKLQKKTKSSKNLSPTSNSPSSAKSRGANLVGAKDNSGSNNVTSKPKKSNSPCSPVKRKSNSPGKGNSSISATNTSVNNSSPITLKVEMPSIHSPLLADDLPEFTRPFNTPIRTYSPKKKSPNVGSPVGAGIPNVIKVVDLKSKVNDELKPEPVTLAKHEHNQLSTPPQKKKEVKEIVVDNKKKKMSEIDRLLMDEGAINLLYEAERGESRRRSNVVEESETSSVNQRRILKSVRRKKKDLLLKTRLVKNAVLRLSNSPSASLAISARITRRMEPPIAQTLPASQVNDPQRKLSLDSRESIGSPAPFDPPSPQSFTYSPRLPLPAEASRIIRRHSSSSNFSSRSASPNNIRIGEASLMLENLNKVKEAQSSVNSSKITGNGVKSGSQSSQGRKKGFPIFVRKPQVNQTYQGKKKKVVAAESANLNGKNSNKISQTNNKELKAPVKATLQKIAADKKRAPVVVKKISISDKLKLKAEMSKNFQKGFQSSGKVKVLKKALENSARSKKKDDVGKDKRTATNGMCAEDDMPDLSSCLAAAASAFAAEALEARDEKASKKSNSSGASHSSSPCPSRSSKSPTPTGKGGKKEPRIAPPLSPNAATYSNMLKTLENESQKPRKKDGEEVTKQRSSVRQNAGTYHYKDISLRRYDNLVQVILTPQSTKMKNALNLQVLKELKDALHQLKKDDSCRAVLLTSTGSSFCQGVDFYSLLHTNAERRKTAAQELAQALKEFLKSLALFNKPIVAGVHGAAVGLGVTMLPFFDMVFASDKATFYTPYAKLGQVPEGAAILTLHHMFGNAVTSELLFACRKLTASEALHFGLVTRILWPDRFQEELIPVIRSMANQSSQSMEATKALLRHSLRTKLDAALESETHLLVQHWISAECQANFKKFLDEGDVGLQKQRVEA